MADVVVSVTVEEPCAVFRGGDEEGEEQSDDRQPRSVALDEGDEVGGGDDAPQYTAGRRDEQNGADDPEGLRQVVERLCHGAR